MQNIRMYIYGALALVILGLTATLFYYRANAASAQAELDIKKVELFAAQEANKQNIETIDKLTQLRNLSEKVISDTNGAIASFNKVASDNQRALTELGQTNAQIRDFLSNDLPDDIKRLLNNRAAGGKN